MVSDSAHTRPAFLWDVTVTEAELRAHLATADPDLAWAAREMDVAVAPLPDSRGRRP